MKNSEPIYHLMCSDVYGVAWDSSYDTYEMAVDALHELTSKLSDDEKTLVQYWIEIAK